MALNGRVRALEHDEGDNYQVNLLSNASLWQPKDDRDTVDLSALLESQRVRLRNLSKCLT